MTADANSTRSAKRRSGVRDRVPRQVVEIPREHGSDRSRDPSDREVEQQFQATTAGLQSKIAALDRKIAKGRKTCCWPTPPTCPSYRKCSVAGERNGRLSGRPRTRRNEPQRQRYGEDSQTRDCPNGEDARDPRDGRPGNGQGRGQGTRCGRVPFLGTGRGTLSQVVERGSDNSISACFCLSGDNTACGRRPTGSDGL